MRVVGSHVASVKPPTLYVHLSGDVILHSNNAVIRITDT